MAEFSRKRLLVGFFCLALTFAGLTTAFYFVAVGGGVAEHKAATFAISCFVLAIGVFQWSAVQQARNPKLPSEIKSKILSLPDDTDSIPHSCRNLLFGGRCGRSRVGGHFRLNGINSFKDC